MFYDFDMNPSTGLQALLYAREPDMKGILLKDMKGNTLETINCLYAQGPRLSPDGSRIAYFDNLHLCLKIHPVMGGEEDKTIEVPGHWSHFCEWSPNGSSMVFTASQMSGSLPPDIYRYDFADECITQLTDNTNMVDRFPQWSMSGEKVAFHRTHIGRTDNYSGTIIIDRDGSNEQILPRVEGCSQGIASFCWSPDSAHVAVIEFNDDGARLVIVNLADNVIAWSKEEPGIHGGCFDPYTGRILIVSGSALRLFEFRSKEPYSELLLSDSAHVQPTLRGPALRFDQYGETVLFLGTDSRLYRWTIGGICETLLEEELPEENAVYKRDDYTFAASDGREIPVQRYVPDHPNGRAIVFVEGGPGAPIDPRDLTAIRLLEEGYEVLRPAYRGCGGYGREHQRANREVCGIGDVRDVVECGIDWKQRFNAHDRPLAVSGFSYGGYLTFLAMSCPDAPWTCGITLWGCIEIPRLFQTAGLPPGSSERQQALQERSPVMQAHRIQFPLLILQGAQDTPPDISVKAIHDQVRAEGIPCELVIFEGETHALRGCRPQMYRHMLEFLDEHMTG